MGKKKETKGKQGMQGPKGQKKIIKLENTQSLQAPPKQTNLLIVPRLPYLERKDICQLGILQNIPKPQTNEQKNQ